MRLNLFILVCLLIGSSMAMAEDLKRMSHPAKLDGEKEVVLNGDVLRFINENKDDFEESYEEMMDEAGSHSLTKAGFGAVGVWAGIYEIKFGKKGFKNRCVGLGSCVAVGGAPFAFDAVAKPLRKAGVVERASKTFESGRGGIPTDVLNELQDRLDDDLGLDIRSEFTNELLYRILGNFSPVNSGDIKQEALRTCQSQLDRNKKFNKENEGELSHFLKNVDFDVRECAKIVMAVLTEEVKDHYLSEANVEAGRRNHSSPAAVVVGEGLFAEAPSHRR